MLEMLCVARSHAVPVPSSLAFRHTVRAGTQACAHSPSPIQCRPHTSAARQALVDKGADINALNDSGLRPVDVANQLAKSPRGPVDKRTLDDIVNILNSAGRPSDDGLLDSRSGHSGQPSSGGFAFEEEVVAGNPHHEQQAGFSEPEVRRLWCRHDTPCAPRSGCG